VTLGVRRRGRLTRASYEGGRRSRAPRARPPASRSAGGVDADAMARIRADRSAPGHEAPSRSRREARKRGETGTPFGTDHGRSGRGPLGRRGPAVLRLCRSHAYGSWPSGPVATAAARPRPVLRGAHCRRCRAEAGENAAECGASAKVQVVHGRSVRPSRDACSRGGEADHERRIATSRCEIGSLASAVISGASIPRAWRAGPRDARPARRA
jgi:hypothetical protein